ncbi:MAG: hybrid sensor histidine kinase/response regulator [Nostocaceae cyanobacterium]|nr:hybrid sensor histidine kinase/response regulator [Nostocaceae cyanobacterium]
MNPQTAHTDKILAVDDIFDNLMVVDSILEDEGYEIVLEEDSKTALSLVEQSPPDLIILDVMMPDLDGYEFTRRIRQNPNLPFIPILLITAHDRSNVVEGLDAGADDFIRKPVDADELQARVRSLLRLKHSIDERDHMANLRQDFVSRFTHDLRIPLAASNRILQLLGDGNFCQVTPELKEVVDSMIGSNNDLLEMVNSLLEVYRHEAGCKTFNFANCDITALIREVVQQLTALAEEKGLTVSLDLGEESREAMGTKRLLIGDRIELRRVFTNIIGNAIKFTNKGSVDISLQRVDNSVAIAIKDTGPGISVQEQQVLFERFRSGKKKGSGSGLGLYLSKRIIEEHRGAIEVSSEHGKGSIFTIYLPFKAEK